MGTSVLFPQDCLPISKSRKNVDLSDAFTGSPIGGKSALHFLDSPLLYSSPVRHKSTPYHGVGPLYLDQARVGFAPYGSNPSRMPVEQMHFNFNRMGELGIASSAAISVPNAPACTILRPKGKEAPRELIADVLRKSGTNRYTTRVSESRPGNRSKGPQSGFLDTRKKSRSNGKKAPVDAVMASTKLSILADFAIREDPKGDTCQLQNVKLGVLKGRRSCDFNYDVTMPYNRLNRGSTFDCIAEHQPLQTMDEVEYRSFKVRSGNKPSRENAVGGRLMRLRRASTDSQIVEHLAHYRSQQLDNPSSQMKAGQGFIRSTSMSLPEKWAGPAYFSSPAPSSLPLPKFSLLGYKRPSLNVPPLLEEKQKSNMTKPVELEFLSAATGPLHAKGDLDVVFATKSLRRMLKLDPS